MAHTHEQDAEGTVHSVRNAGERERTGRVDGRGNKFEQEKRRKLK